MHGYNFTVRRGVRAHCAKICCVLGIAALLTGCTGNSKVGRVLGFEKSTPDEFAVVKRAPLTLPPDYGLRPPKPGAPRPQAVSPRSDAKKSLLSASSKPPASASDTRSAARRAKRAQINAQAKGRSSSEVAQPHSAEVAVKPTMEPRKTRRRPNRVPSHPVSTVPTALATTKAVMIQPT